LTLLFDDITEFVKEHTGARKVTERTDLFDDLGCSGDDLHELMRAYAKEFKVDMTRYRWYFHNDEDGQNIGGMFFKPPYQRVQRIPITPSVLMTMAEKGRWEVDYPPHEIPSERYDILINQLLVLTVLLLFAWACYKS